MSIRAASSKKKRRQIFEKLGISNDITLNEYEEVIAGHVVCPEDISVAFKDIGGLNDVIGELKESVISPLMHPELFTSFSSLLTSPSGVLLYGPPGCGKTLVAKALAKESGSRFINAQVSTLLDQYLGQTEKFVHAVFSLARKIKPCIIFVDEIDALTRERGRNDHESLTLLKSEFLMSWEGLLTDKVSQVLVLGATNRPQDIDKAFLRRMPRQFKIGLPGVEQRMEILNLLLADAKLQEGFDIFDIAEMTEGYSGADLKELCRLSILRSVQEHLHDERKSDLRFVTMQDFNQTVRLNRQHSYSNQ